MTPENWPEPVAIRYNPSIIFPDVVLKPYSPGDVGLVEKYTGAPPDPLYTETQVREIVAAETSQIKLDADEMVRQIGSAAELGLEYAQSELTNYDQSYDRHPSTEGGRSAITSDISEIKTAINDARKWLKENKDAD